MTKPRLQISLAPETMVILRRLAASQKSPMSRIVSELIDDSAPMLGKMAETLDALTEAAKHHKAEIQSTLKDSEVRARAAATEVVSLLDNMAKAAKDHAGKARDRREASRREGTTGRTAKARKQTRPPMSNRGATPHPPHPPHHRNR